MTDVFFPADRHSDDKNQPETIDVIELLFFAYRDFVGEPDVVLHEFGFGRAHHRVLHFVYRNPGMTVADLLDILQITKQSLSRVLSTLVEQDYVVQKAGAEDKRQRLLFASPKGEKLVQQLLALQSSRVERAMDELDPRQRATVAKFLSSLRNQPRERK